jgi:hypothetical protein
MPGELLQDLIEDERNLTPTAEKAMQEVIKPFAYIGKTDHEIHFREEANDLSARHKILLTFLGKLAVLSLGFADDATLSQGEVVEKLDREGVAEGSVKSGMNRLRADKILTSPEKGRYEITYNKLKRMRGEFRV